MLTVTLNWTVAVDLKFEMGITCSRFNISNRAYFALHPGGTFSLKQTLAARVGVSDDLDKNDDLMTPNRVIMT